jgi:hypothetical protein
MVPRKQAGHMTCTRPPAERQILLAMRASSTHDPLRTGPDPAVTFASVSVELWRVWPIRIECPHLGPKHLG